MFLPRYALFAIFSAKIEFQCQADVQKFPLFLYDIITIKSRYQGNQKWEGRVAIGICY